MSSHHSPIRILSIDVRSVTLAAETDDVRWHADSRLVYRRIDGNVDWKSTRQLATAT